MCASKLAMGYAHLRRINQKFNGIFRHEKKSALSKSECFFSFISVLIDRERMRKRKKREIDKMQSKFRSCVYLLTFIWVTFATLVYLCWSAHERNKPWRQCSLTKREWNYERKREREKSVLFERQMLFLNNLKFNYFREKLIGKHSVDLLDGLNQNTDAFLTWSPDSLLRTSILIKQCCHHLYEYQYKCFFVVYSSTVLSPYYKYNDVHTWKRHNTH